MRIDILIRPKSEWGKRNDIALHSLEPSVNRIIDLVIEAEKDMFPRIVIYTDKNTDKMSDLGGNSTWNILRKTFPDTRFGEVVDNAGRSCWGIGTGFTIYL